MAFNQTSGHLIRLVTLAPEIPGATNFIHWLYQEEIIVSAGRTNATYQQMQDAMQAGLSHATHLFNAMRGMHHREPGVVGAALTDPGLTAEIIADGIHFHPIILKMIHQMKGTKKLLLITDAMRATGLKEGTYDLGGQEVIVNRGQAQLKDGTLACSVLTMNKAVHNMVTKAGISLQEAVQMASYNPAKCLGIDDKKDSLKPGKDNVKFSVFCFQKNIPKQSHPLIPKLLERKLCTTNLSLRGASSCHCEHSEAILYLYPQKFLLYSN